ncbi:MAG: DUF167 domain-containing protein [Methanophagales archaeon]|nr:DUF167 domain-containing protein [Methanophagales archaeon]
MSVKTQVKVKVVPNSKKAKVEQTEGGVLRVNVDAPAKEGKANKRLVEILAKYFSKPKSSIRIVKGWTSKNKVVEVD